MEDRERKWASDTLHRFMEISNEELARSPAYISFVDKLEVVSAADGDLIIREGEFGDKFYIVEQGTVEIVKDSENGLSLSLLSAGDFFGELALFTGEPRAATAVARGGVLLFSLSKAHFEQLIREFPQINGAFLRQIYNRLKASHRSLENKNEQLKEAYQVRVELGFVFTSVVLVVSAFSFLFYLFQSDFVHRLPQAHAIIYLGSRLIEVVTLAVIISIVVKSKLPIRSFGLTLAGWRKDVWESLAISLAAIALLTGLKYALLEYTQIPVFRDEPLVSWAYVDWTYFTYLIVAPLQEFIARGVFQGSIQRLLPGRSSSAGAIWITSLVFGALHLHSSLSLGIAALVSSLLWGWMYARHRSLLGVSLSHFLIGNYIGLLGVWEYL